MKKLILIVENFFIERDYKRFGIKYYINNNIRVEVWDITEFSNKDFNKFIVSNDEVKGEYIKKFKNIDEIKVAFKQLEGELLMFVHVDYRFDTLKLFKLLSDYKLNYITYNGSSPSKDPSYEKTTIFRKFKKAFILFKNRNVNVFHKYLKNLITGIVSPKFFGISDAPFLLAGGLVSIQKKK